MTNREEIIVQIGVDQKGVASGLNASARSFQQFGENVEAITDKFTTKLGKKLNKLFYGSLVSTLLHLAQQVLEAANEKFWESFYGATPEANAQYKAAHERIQSIATAMRKAVEEYEKAQKKFRDENATPEGNLEYAREAKRVSDLEVEKLEKEAAKKTKARAEISRRLEFGDYRAGEYRKLFDLEQKRILDLAEVQTKLNEAKARNIELDEKVDKARDAVAEKNKKAADAKEKELEQLDREAAARRKASDAAINAKHREIAAAAEAKRQNVESYMPTLQEFAQQQSWSRDAFSGKIRTGRSGIAVQAQGLLDLKQRAHNQFLAGNVEGAKRSIESFNQKYDRMAGMGLVPRRAEEVAQAQVDTANFLKDISTGKAVLTTIVELPE